MIFLCTHIAMLDIIDIVFQWLIVVLVSVSIIDIV